MKKLFTLTLALILALSLTACRFFQWGEDPAKRFPPAQSTQVPENTSTPDPGQSTNPPSVSADSKIVGHWKHTGVNSYGTYYVFYSFYENGTFQCESSYSSWTRLVGKYSVSNGKVYFTEVKCRVYTLDSWTAEENHDDETMEYILGSDSDGAYLRINDIAWTSNAEITDGGAAHSFYRKCDTPAPGFSGNNPEYHN